MKGKNKRRKYGFTTTRQRPTHESTKERAGNTGARERIIRVDNDLHDFVTEYHNSNGRNDGINNLSRDVDGKPVDMMALRPKRASSLTCETQCNKDSYIIVHQMKLEDFWNTVFREHLGYHEKCRGRLIFNDECNKNEH